MDKKNFNKTILMTVALSMLFAVASISTQVAGQNKLTTPCSYIDPVTINILAFIVTLFLMIEGIYKIYQEREIALKKQITRSLRVAAGFAIFVMHILQVLYK